MKLRKARKAPKRFDDYEWEQEEEDRELRATATSPKARVRSAIHNRPHNLPYNPNLHPAAFPTLEYGTSRKVNSMAAGSPHAKSLVLNGKIESLIEWLRSNKIKAEKAQPAMIPTPPLYTTPPGIQPGSMYDKLCRMTAQRKTAEIIFYQNQPESDVYVRNMEILDRMAKKTADDWNIQEMITSDEEDSSPVTSSQLKKVRHTQGFRALLCPLIKCQSALKSTPTPTATPSVASWEKLSIAHQLDLVYTLSKVYGTVTEAMQQLHLDTNQSQQLLQFIERYPESQLDEAKHMSQLAAEKIPIMLSSDSDEDDRKHFLCINVEQLTLSTSKELAKAKAYLESCGKMPTLLDHWRSLLYDHGSSCGKNCQKLVPSLLLPAKAEKVRPSLTSNPERPTFEHTSRPCEEGSSQKSLFKASDFPITFLYPISPDSSPPLRKFAEVGRQKIARQSYLAADRPSTMPSSQRALASRRQNLSSACSSFEPASSELSPATSSFSPATSSFSSTSSRLEPNNTRERRSSGRMAGKYRPVTSQRKKKLGLGSSSKCVDPIHRLRG